MVRRPRPESSTLSSIRPERIDMSSSTCLMAEGRLKGSAERLRRESSSLSPIESIEEKEQDFLL
jgi:hypothetical protein